MKALVAGIGNIFSGDDGFGCEVAQRLAQEALPENVDVVDFGIRGMDLGYALMDGYDLAILVDAVDRGDAPGTLYVIEPELEAGASAADAASDHAASPHGMDPATVLRFIAALDGQRPRVLLVACQPASLGGEQGRMGLSEAVAAVVDEAVAEVRRLLRTSAQELDHMQPMERERLLA